jgi:hypothetical protein
MTVLPCKREEKTMINVKNGEVELKGTAYQLHSDLVAILRGMISAKILSKSQLDFLTKIAYMSDEEIVKKGKEAQKNLKEAKADLQKMLDFLNEIGGDEGDTFTNMFKDLDI